VEALIRDGMMKAEIVSFSLYGAMPLYTVGALRNAELVDRIYPGWKARFYVDNSVPHNVIDALRERNAEIVLIEKNLGPMYGRYWRILVASDPDVERYIIRDCDSRLNWREKAGVDEWLASGCSFHVMRDSIHHKTRMLAGMWGGLGGIIKNIEPLIDSWGKYSVHGENDQFVSEKIYPLIKHDYICHDSWGHFPDARPFPKHAPLEGTSFVGEIVPIDHDSIDVWRRLGELGDETVKLKLENEANQLQATRSEYERDAAQVQLATIEAERDTARAELNTVAFELRTLRLQTEHLRRELSENRKQFAKLQVRIVKSQRVHMEILETITIALQTEREETILLATRWNKLVGELKLSDGPICLKWPLWAARMLRALFNVYRRFYDGAEGKAPFPLDASPFDIYVQPHLDDICFSLGAFAYKRRCGILLTVFPISAYMPNPQAAMYPIKPLEADHPFADWITDTRMNEDKAFAETCHLEINFMAIPCASVLGHDPFDLSWVNQNHQRIASPLLKYLLTAAAGRPSGMRPWLFCPSGIGGHVDHVAVRIVVIQNYRLLSIYYRIGFYEDLHYASDADARVAGIRILQSELQCKPLQRYAFPLAEHAAEKLSLIRIYSSQFLETSPRCA
jgi:hypothetical protein